MKNNWLYVVVFCFLFSCKKEVERPVPEFEVTTASTSYAVGEEVVFNFSGDADLISFYSGEIMRDYAFRDGRVVEPGVLKLSFFSNVQFGTQANQLALMASTGFNGNYSFDGGIDAASWTDITSRFVLSTNTTYTSSGAVDVSDLVEDGKPLYLAFRYTTKNQATEGVGRTWRVQNFLLTSQTSIGLITLGDLQTSGFQLVDRKPDIAPMRSTLSATTLSMVAHARTPDNETVESENWAISKAFYGGTQDLGPDRPVAIKGITDAELKNYTHVYNQPGTYSVYFIAKNTNIYNSHEVIKSIEIEIVE